jgi:hypothetical protein
MGITIHYQGRIADKKKLPQLIEELEEISKVHNWKYYILETSFPKDDFPEDEHDGLLYGICMNPPDCELLSITFLRNGRMCGPMQFHNWGESSDETERKYLYFNFTKTQYAGPEIHKMIIGIFRYIVPLYLTDFELIDESEYWETKDETLLNENFKRSTDLINDFTAAFRKNTKQEGEDIETYLERVIKEFRGKKTDQRQKSKD